MTAQTFAAMLTMFVLGLFIGTNLGVLLMCLLQINRDIAPAVAK